VLQEDRTKREEQQQLVAEAKADPRHKKVMEQAQQENASRRAAVEQHQAEQRQLADEARATSRLVVDRVLQEDRTKREEQQQGNQDSTPKHKGVRGALHRGIARVKGLVGGRKST
jgi:hypothetical protein